MAIINNTTIRGTAMRLKVNTGTENSKVYATVVGEGDLQMTLKGATSEVTSKDSGDWAEYAKTIRSWSGTINATFVTTDTGAKRILTDVYNNAHTWVTLVDTTAMSITATGKALFTDFNWNFATADQFKLSCTFQGTGTLSISGLT